MIGERDRVGGGENTRTDGCDCGDNPQSGGSGGQ